MIVKDFFFLFLNQSVIEMEIKTIKYVMMTLEKSHLCDDDDDDDNIVDHLIFVM